MLLLLLLLLNLLQVLKVLQLLKVSLVLEQLLVLVLFHGQREDIVDAEGERSRGAGA